MKKLVIGSPIKQKNNILKEFILSLSELNLSNFDVYYYFIDDNTDPLSSIELNKFMNNNKNVIIKKGTSLIQEENKEYICTSHSHQWKSELINRIIIFKNDIIRYSKEIDADFLFFVDSDIILHPNTISHLASRNVDIVSNIFWTKWSTGGKIYPQVWVQDENSYYVRDWEHDYSTLEKLQFEKDFVSMLKIPGLYKVGGLGACTLINKKSLQKGISFSLIDNVSFWGEDRHFCIRARVLGLNLYVDTVYPAFHIYRENYLPGVSTYKESGFNFEIFENLEINSKKTKQNSNLKMMYKKARELTIRIEKKVFRSKRVINSKHSVTLSMIVKNEEGRFLEKMLEHTKKFVDQVLIIDDASTDNTVKICEDILSDIPHKIIVNDKSMFQNEVKLRKKQWKETLALNPDWILFLDADEIFEDKINEVINYLINNNDIDLYCFKLFDMWNENEYRDDELWNAHKRYMPFLLRYQPNFRYKFKNTSQHCGRMPYNVLNLDYANLDIRIKHYGWSREEDRKKKYDRYMELDSEGKNGNLEQYKSILDENPHLERFYDEN